MSSFAEQIQKFNKMYKLPVSKEPSLNNLGVSALERLRHFKAILLEEVSEIDEIILDLEVNAGSTGNITKRIPELTILTKLADLLGDIQVYCSSEMAKFGLPLDEILCIIMQSNFSKLGADGLPIYDSRGKLMKGPGYWKPEPKIEELLTHLLKEQK